ncbi:hypothetical protein SKAU_G00089970 [Synaphobranchus kaupii]|uniref:C-type lectin domain-containing protein n=1 Tax=Synaphobranchus kaupii TaxID=118154 RepID=A0A9Q1FX19_SYNKA|nr:hypothetical protein SKAU_G00089970 [Synaphobranchus kaupii]
MSSRRDCIKRGADLVIIDSEKEQEFITEHKRDYSWIGLSNLETEVTWLWVDGSPLSQQFWGSSEPDNGPRKNCAQTDVNNWVAHNCATDLNWICETNVLLP